MSGNREKGLFGGNRGFKKGKNKLDSNRIFKRKRNAVGSEVNKKQQGLSEFVYGDRRRGAGDEGNGDAWPAEFLEQGSSNKRGSNQLGVEIEDLFGLNDSAKNNSPGNKSRGSDEVYLQLNSSQKKLKEIEDIGPIGGSKPFKFEEEDEQDQGEKVNKNKRKVKKSKKKKKKGVQKQDKQRQHRRGRLRFKSNGGNPVILKSKIQRRKQGWMDSRQSGLDDDSNDDSRIGEKNKNDVGSIENSIQEKVLTHGTSKKRERPRFVSQAERQQKKSKKWSGNNLSRLGKADSQDDSILDLYF